LDGAGDPSSSAAASGGGGSMTSERGQSAPLSDRQLVGRCDVKSPPSAKSENQCRSVCLSGPFDIHRPGRILLLPLQHVNYSYLLLHYLNYFYSHNNDFELVVSSLIYG